MSQKPPSLLYGVGLSIVAMTASLALVTSDPVRNSASNTSSSSSIASDSAATDSEATSGSTEQSLSTMTATATPEITGTLRFRERLEHSTPQVSESIGVKFSTQWYRNGEAISNATKSTYTLGAKDVGQSISVAVTAKKDGFADVILTSAPTQEIEHAKDVRTTVKYHVASRGESDTDFEEFRTEVEQILNDPRGWRSDGIAFEEVDSGAVMVVYLATSAQVPSFSSHCSAYWSCRVGANVVINQERWENATDTWNAINSTTITGYRHMVINHEVGHWLGLGHSHCTGNGDKAPLMMQQSKGLNGCKANPWPLAAEMNPPRFR